MPNEKKDYQAFRALIQSGELVYPKKDSDKLLFPSLHNCAWLAHRGQPKLWDDDNKKHYPEYQNLKNQNYSINSIGFRGKNFSQNPSDILTAGCSQTWGIGVPDPYVWPEMLGSRLNLSVDNIGYSAKSIAGIVQLIFCYLREIGSPKYIFVAFPDPFRIIFPTTNNFMHAKYQPDLMENQPMIANTGLNKTRRLSEKPKYASAPYFLEEMITEEIAIWQAVSYIQMLEDYCNASGIFLRYGSWDPSSTELFDSISNQNNFYKNYVSLESLLWENVNEKNKEYIYKPNLYCHEELKDEENILFWDNANDYYYNNSMNAHMGVHRHIHIAEIFEKEVLNNG